MPLVLTIVGGYCMFTFGPETAFFAVVLVFTLVGIMGGIL